MTLIWDYHLNQANVFCHLILDKQTDIVSIIDPVHSYEYMTYWLLFKWLFISLSKSIHPISAAFLKHYISKATESYRLLYTSTLNVSFSTTTATTLRDIWSETLIFLPNSLREVLIHEHSVYTAFSVFCYDPAGRGKLNGWGGAVKQQIKTHWHLDSLYIDWLKGNVCFSEYAVQPTVARGFETYRMHDDVSIDISAGNLTFSKSEPMAVGLRRK